MTTWSCPVCLVGACHACTGRVTIHRPDSTGQPARDEPCGHWHPGQGPAARVLADIPHRSAP